MVGGYQLEYSDRFGPRLELKTGIKAQAEPKNNIGLYHACLIEFCKMTVFNKVNESTPIRPNTFAIFSLTG